MGKIKILSEHISNKIAAGEVVERPASVVKELIENSIDANSTLITIEIKDGGISFIRVTDNGNGIASEDTVIAFERHATSKIESEKDLDMIVSLGFRGEALASIASVSQVELITKMKNDINGTVVEVNGGVVVKKQEIGCPNGTTIIIKNLFYNTPARLKFLKKESTEAGQISNYVERLALTHPEISFKLINNNKQVIFTSGNGDILTTILSVFGKEFANSMLPVNYSNEIISLSGFIGKPEISRSNRNYQCLFINNRYIKDRIISAAIDSAFKTLLTINKYPSVVLYMNISHLFVDVNVHPSKMEVRFDNEINIYDNVYEAVYKAINESILIPTISLHSNYQRDDENINNNSNSNDNFITKSLDDLFASSKNNEYVYTNNSKDSVFKEKINNYDYTNIDNNDRFIPSNGFNVNIENPTQIVEEKMPSLIENQEQIVLNYNFKIIGQIFSTYLVIESEDKMFLIDQHAAHERIKFNELSIKYDDGNILSQGLISPLTIELSFDEYKKALENIELFNKIGYEIEPFGDTTFLIRSVPYVLYTNYSKDYFIEVIDLLSEKKISNILDLREGILSTMACKSAIKAKEKLQNDEIKELINSVMKNTSTLTCPHGRPVIISISKYEIEKMFKRIQ